MVAPAGTPAPILEKVHADLTAVLRMPEIQQRLGDLAVGDRWADLAIASLSLDWNFGEGHQDELFEAYGIEPDEERIRYYRALWHLES